MIGFHVGDRGQRRREVLERPVALVGLHHEEVPVPPERASPDASDVGPEHVRGGKVGRQQDQREHRRCGRLSMRPCHRCRGPKPRERRHHRRPSDDGEPPYLCLDQLWVARRDGG